MDSFDMAIMEHTSWLTNPTFAWAITILLVIYASMAAHQLPPTAAKILDHPILKFIAFFIVICLSRVNMTIALVAAMALVISLISLYGNRTSDMDENVASTDDGKMIENEAKQAVSVGALHPTAAAAIVGTVLAKEGAGKPVLVATTQEGASRIAEVAKAESTGVIAPAEAKQLAAKIIVHEAVTKTGGEAVAKVGAMGTSGAEAGKIDTSIAKTTDGKMILAAANTAIASGALHPSVANAVVHRVVQRESAGQPVMAALTTDGAAQMTEIKKSHASGALDVNSAKQLAAKVVVKDVVNAQKNPASVLPTTVTRETVSHEIVPKLANLAENILKQKKLAAKQGAETSHTELQQMCNNALNDYSSSSDNSGDLLGVDEEASSYASAHHY